MSEDDIVALGMLVFRQELKPGNQHHVLFDNHHFAKTGLSGVTPNLGQCASLRVLPQRFTLTDPGALAGLLN